MPRESAPLEERTQEEEEGGPPGHKQEHPAPKSGARRVQRKKSGEERERRQSGQGREGQRNPAHRARRRARRGRRGRSEAPQARAGILPMERHGKPLQEHSGAGAFGRELA